MNARKLIFALFGFVIVSFFAACDKGAVDVVDAGTYSGVVAQATIEDQEALVKLDNGKAILLTFDGTVPIMKGTQRVHFEALAPGTKIRVDVTRKGDSNIPKAVAIQQ